MGGPHLLVATIGEGLWRSEDGDQWSPEAGIPADARVFSLAGDGHALIAGGGGCIYRDEGDGWVTRPLPATDLQVWSLAVDPARPSTIFAGCRPLALLRSDDGGASWRHLDLVLPPDTPRPHTPRVTAILVEDGAVWCGVEVGGVFVSADGGATWTAVNDGLPSLDIHALARGRAPLAATPRGIARREERWQAAALHAPWTYCRALVAAPGRPGEFLGGLGDGPPGTRGGIVVSEDDGRSWRSALFPGTAASTVWTIGTSPAAPDLALAAAIGGELFTSKDGGRSWDRLPRRFGEVRSVLIA